MIRPECPAGGRDGLADDARADDGLQALHLPRAFLPIPHLPLPDLFHDMPEQCPYGKATGDAALVDGRGDPAGRRGGEA